MMDGRTHLSVSGNDYVIALRYRNAVLIFCVCLLRDGVGCNFVSVNCKLCPDRVDLFRKVLESEYI